jgi:hypothetical protein
MGLVESVTLQSRFTSVTHWIGGWVDLRAGLDIEAIGKILCLCLGSNSNHPTCREKPYYLSYTSP